MENEFNITELYAVSLPELENIHFLGELIPRSLNDTDKPFFGKVNFEDDQSFVCTIGTDRSEIERNSTELIRYSLEDQKNDLLAAQLHRKSKGRTGALN